MWRTAVKRTSIRSSGRYRGRAAIRSPLRGRRSPAAPSTSGSASSFSTTARVHEQSSRSAHERTPDFVEAQRPVLPPREADTRRYADPRRPFERGANPEHGVFAKIRGIEARIDAERGRQSSGAAREIFEFRTRTPPAHQSDAVDRYERADQHRGADPFAFGGNVQAMRRAIHEPDVGVAALHEERRVAFGAAAKGVTRRIADRVRFRLDDASAQATRRQFAHQDLADEKTRKCHGIDGQLAPCEARNRQGAAQRYFNPVPVLKTTTLSVDRTKPLARNFASAAQAAPPSGHTSIPELDASAWVAASASGSSIAIAVPWVARNARRQRNPPRGDGTRKP